MTEHRFRGKCLKAWVILWIPGGFDLIVRKAKSNSQAREVQESWRANSNLVLEIISSSQFFLNTDLKHWSFFLKDILELFLTMTTVKCMLPIKIISWLETFSPQQCHIPLKMVPRLRNSDVSILSWSGSLEKDSAVSCLRNKGLALTFWDPLRGRRLGYLNIQPSVGIRSSVLLSTVLSPP